MRLVETIKKVRDDFERKYQEVYTTRTLTIFAKLNVVSIIKEKARTEDLCLQLVDTRNALEAEHKALEEQSKNVSEKKVRPERRQSIAVRFDKETRANLIG